MISMKLKLWRTAGAAAALVGLAGCYAHGHGGYGYGEGGSITASAGNVASVENTARAADNRRPYSCE